MCQRSMRFSRLVSVALPAPTPGPSPVPTPEPLPPPDPELCRRLIRRVVSSSLRNPPQESEKIVIPGYAGLRQFSAANEDLLKAECGGAWQGYVQRGNWRMIFPFSRHQQEGVAQRLVAGLKSGWPLVVHLARFPSLLINHAIVLYRAD